MFQLVIVPSSVWPMIASALESTMADSCRARARSVASAVASVSVTTTPLTSAPVRYGRMRTKNQEPRSSATSVSTREPSACTLEMSSLKPG
jgi:hypothetical protein